MLKNPLAAGCHACYFLLLAGTISTTITLIPATTSWYSIFYHSVMLIDFPHPVNKEYQHNFHFSIFSFQ
jgi:hypothetical protein